MRLPRTVIALGAVSLLTDASSEMIYPLLPVFLSTVLGAGPLAIGAIEGAAESVAVGSPRTISITIARGQGDSLQKEAKVNTPLVAPLALHAPVGEYVVRSGDEVVARVPLVALAKVDEGGWWRTSVDTVKLWFE